MSKPSRPVAQAKKRRPGGRTAEVRAAVFAAARALFTPGAPLPTMAQIAERAGVQKTTLYRNWARVEQLIYEAQIAVPQAAIPIPNSGSLRGDLRALARTAHAWMSSPEGRSLLTMMLQLPDEAKRDYWRNRHALLRTVFERAVARGEIAARDDWDLFIDMQSALFYFYLWAKGEVVPLAQVYAAVDVLLVALTR